MRILRIYFSGQWRDSASPCSWALSDESGAVLQSGIDPLASLPRGDDCIGIVAPDRVLCVAVKLPPGARRRWQASLPFLAEEFTLPDPEDNHVVPGPVAADGRLPVVVVEKQWLKRIIEACRVSNLSLRRIVPESLLPPLRQGNWVLVWDGRSGFLRTGPAQGVALDNGDSDTVPVELQLCLNAVPGAPPKNIEIRFFQPVAREQRVIPRWDIPALTLSAGADWDWRRAPIPDDALNLMWGDFAPRAKIREWWPKVRPAVAIVVLVCAVETIGANLEWARLAHEKKTLEQEMARSFHAAFGEASTLVDAPLQMRRNLAGLRHAAGLADDGDFLALLDAAAPELAKLPPGSVQALHYEAGRLDVDLRLARGGEPGKLRQRLDARGLNVQMSDTRDTGNGTETRLSLMPGAGS
jgi:general secretion pathway protein L